MSPEDALKYDDFWRKNGIGSNKTWEEFRNVNPNSKIDDYLDLVKNENPFPNGTTPKETVLQSGDRFSIALNKDQPRTSPGRFATQGEISSVDYVRNNLAVKEAWKADPRVVVEYSVKEGVSIPAKTGFVGPQIDLGANKYLPGGADQINILLDRDVNMMEYLKIESVKNIE